MTLIQQFNRQLAQQKLLTPAATVVVAVSTGVDSMVLLTLLQQIPLHQRPRLIVAHVNHHLRAQSVTEADFITTYCQQRQLVLKLADWPLAAHPTHGIEAAARQFRYDFFTQVMQATGAKTVLTAHHANDQVETYLMKLARGGDLAQLVGIQATRPLGVGHLVRPLLDWSKQALRDYATTQQVPYFEDATNTDVQLTRNRVRHRVVPELTAVNSALLTHVASYETQLQTVLSAQAQMVTVLLPTVLTATQQLRLPALQQLPSQWRLVVLQAWLEQQAAVRLSAIKLQPYYQWLKNSQQPTGTVQLSATVMLVKAGNLAEVRPLKKRDKKLMPSEKIMVDLDQWQKITDWQTAGVFQQAPNSTAQPFRLQASDWPLTFRRWQSDDRLALKGHGHQSVRRILIDQKVPVAQRSTVMVLVTASGTVLWLVGHKFSYRAPDVGHQTVFLALKHTELKGVHLKR
ncbi:tRNA lysidine(34) synthetase TilS [Lactobacillus sp. CBA3606]|uniref:tRNA lysidine(34) synthetase TilS n=1 Tax=Lactobacillus sp. CBA3606 TaxID=2099789 RepID=UPI000CFAB671|nr:tRNA lysidine(34) synthetase TilS [Lactobacillus sp. CBA3606]AVK64415.1 tRNA lysidine(34) synthetase TilS [Lactobacillus sp. CBA3606]